MDNDKPPYVALVLVGIAYVFVGIPSIIELVKAVI